MKAGRGISVAVGSALLGLVVLCASGFTFRDWIVEKWYLWRLGGAPLEAWTKGLEHKDPWIGFVSVRALVAMGPVAYPSITKALEDPHKPVWSKTVDSLVTIGPQAVPALLAVVRLDDSGDLRHTGAIPALLRIGSGALPEIERVLGGPEWEERGSAAVALRFFVLSGNDQDHVSRLLFTALKDPNEKVREMAALALGCFKSIPDAVIPALQGGLQDNTEEVRVRAATSLVQLHAPKEAIPTLIRSIKSEKHDLRSEACAQLGFIGPAAQDAIPALKDALSDPNSSVRDEAAEALKKIQGK